MGPMAELVLGCVRAAGNPEARECNRKLIASMAGSGQNAHVDYREEKQG